MLLATSGWDLAVDDANVYSARATLGGVGSVPKGGGAGTTIAHDSTLKPNPIAVLTDATSIYWTNE